ncbi:MAG: hypothetical protein A4E36_01399 [Methanoregulaceae archaeon PtaB.Bin009]|jgi:hypothetical protein|nr:MAG: hypothetical protein A4E36_01399 [Methanoregulaceae archaeon PtaB.Bin009]OPY39478.1 MAG: hypothetical protein A4E41_01712 [Methanoregulaceae archaeon PtaU1.Bin066]HNQ29900.1 hypothetical protein [Methanolinea sp.]
MIIRSSSCGEALVDAIRILRGAVELYIETFAGKDIVTRGTVISG